MKVPRDQAGEELARVLSKLGYRVTRQTGSHMRLTTWREGEHHLTIPAHKVLSVGTLNSILREVGEHHNLGRSELIELLWG
jgi:predicted RNA binding protein YcfA (HicA-like mRNA interferase family)